MISTQPSTYHVGAVGIDAKSLALGQANSPWHNLAAAAVAGMALAEEAWHRSVEAGRVAWHRWAVGLPGLSEGLSPPVASRHSVAGAVLLRLAEAGWSQANLADSMLSTTPATGEVSPLSTVPQVEAHLPAVAAAAAVLLPSTTPITGEASPFSMPREVVHPVEAAGSRPRMHQARTEASAGRAAGP